MERYFALRDVSTRSEAGRSYIDAYASVFNVPQEIRDREGHYLEVIAPGAFDRTLAQRAGQLQVLFNHGMTVHGTPSDRWTSPIGLPVEVRADEIGLWTVTEMARTEAAAEVYQLVQDGIVRGMSFSGQFLATTDQKPAKRGDLGTKLRTEASLREYGPTPFPAYAAAKVVAARADLSILSPDDLTEYLLTLDEQTRAHIVRSLDPAAPRTVPDGPQDPPHAIGSHSTAARARRLALLNLKESA
jgi:HK97 family phage prohead protease